MGRERLYNIDLVKGILIILVIIGHMIPGKVNGILIRYIIYSFHMPIFIAISGYLLNKSFLLSNSLYDVLKKYVPKLMLPWMIAIILYFFAVKPSYTLLEFVKAFIKPYYHLWYILGFISYIIITWMLLKMKLSSPMLLAITLAVSIISKLQLYDIGNPTLARIVNLIHYDLRLYNLFFFILGMFLKDYMSKLQKSKVILPLMGIWAFIAWAYNLLLFYNMDKEMKQLLYYGLNIPMCVMILLLCKKELLPRCRRLEYMGQQSLSFYLWHVMAIILAVNIVGSKTGILYYGLCITFLGVLYLGVYIRSKKVSD